MLRRYVATAVLAGVTLTAVPASGQMRLPSSPITLNKSSSAAPTPKLEQSNLPVAVGKWGTSDPYNRPCYAGMITEPCSTPGPSVRIELPGFRVKK
jgi:hypothetical protein